MLVKISNYLKQKGQGIVEYALLLAFIVGLAMMLNGANLGGAVKGVFDDVASLLGGENKYVAALKKWGDKTKAELKQISNPERLAADQQALINIGQAFVGLKVSYINSKLLTGSSENEIRNSYIGDDLNGNGNKEIVVLNFEPDSSVQGIEDPWKLRSNNGQTKGMNPMQWMQADYGTAGENGQLNYSAAGFDNNKKYFYSDQMIDNKGSDGFGWANDQWSDHRSVRISFTVNQDTDVVEAARVRINRGTHTAAKSHMHELDVTVTNDGARQTHPDKTGIY